MAAGTVVITPRRRRRRRRRHGKHFRGVLGLFLLFALLADRTTVATVRIPGGMMGGPLFFRNTRTTRNPYCHDDSVQQKRNKPGRSIIIRRSTQLSPTTAPRVLGENDRSIVRSIIARQLFLLRGGGEHDSFDIDWDLEDGVDDDEKEQDSSDDDMYDDDDDIDDADEDEATAMHQQRRNLQRHHHHHQDASSSTSSRPFNEDAAAISSKSRSSAPYIPRKKNKEKKKHFLTQMAQSSLSVSKKAALTTVQTSGKAAFYLMRPKSIRESELWGVWRLDQQVGVKQSTASIEFTKRGHVIIRRGQGGGDVIWKAPYRFITPTWPQSCRVEFEARAFQPDNDDSRRPWRLFYKGYLERKVVDSSVIKMAGKLYKIERPKGMFGKELPVRYTKIGSFVGRRRVVIQDDDDDDDDVNSDYSDDDRSYFRDRQLPDRDSVDEGDERHHGGERRSDPEYDGDYEFDDDP